MPLDSKNHEGSGGVLHTAAGGSDGLWVIFLNPVRPDPALPAILELGLLSMEHKACFLDFLF